MVGGISRDWLAEDTSMSLKHLDPVPRIQEDPTLLCLVLMHHLSASSRWYGKARSGQGVAHQAPLPGRGHRAAVIAAKTLPTPKLHRQSDAAPLMYSNKGASSINTAAEPPWK